jgi:hypothetical protein
LDHCFARAEVAVSVAGGHRQVAGHDDR